MTAVPIVMPRRWGVWCNDPAAGWWLRALSLHDPATSFVGVRAGADDESVWHGIACVEFVSDWQTLLVDPTLDAVFLAGVDEDRLSAMRQMVEQDRPVWIWPDSRHGLPFAYQLALIAGDRPNHLHGVWPHRADAVLQPLASTMMPQDLEHIELERVLDGIEYGDVDLSTVLQRHLLADLDLLRWFGGHATRVTALRTTGHQGRLRKLSVQLASDSGPSVSWSGEFLADGERGARLMLQGTRRMTVRQNAAGVWSDGTHFTNSRKTFDGHAATVPWTEVVRAFEWFDACDHSLERRRTIELHSEPVSERTVFKTQMTAVGCLLLIATLLLLLVYLAVAATVPLPGWLLLVLRTLVFAPLAAFLLAQLLLPLSRTPRSENAKAPTSNTSV